MTEAMSSATPVVSFMDTGPAGIIEYQKTGYLARYVDFRDLTEGVKWLFKDSLLLESLSYNARNKVETTYDIKIIAKHYKEPYRFLLEETGFETRILIFIHE